ncbi:2Fe-2S iron-sulfur cluster binding domain-containing protein [Stappia sp. GBMRC 2046]|uniref:2Fe-2S iron-sulfur cluster binding domain-containing protein n=1 Tax=Stappia sediminis TaxID=2692190 RepID=A0A7X3LY53_9HYPH|nr:PDR/VanB family oxidoreductase [Stappia sediminis]MXN67176.1 2Fe-2S iron-sulfur cluster binding domain-containing protein [Stappia sediminis]
MKGRQEWRGAVVTRAQSIADGIRLIEFAVEGGLPPFEPGSHVSVEVMIEGAPAIRSYTCVSSDAGHIRLAVKRHENSRGGSRFMWTLVEGARLRITLPENRFALSWRASSYLLLAGGIGITPIYGMAKALSVRARPVRLAYAASTRGELAFAGELSELMGTDAEFFVSEEGRRIDLAAEFAELPPDGEAYICGPLGMLNAAKAAWAATGRPSSRLRFEVFGDSGERPEVPFSVEIAGIGKRVDVASDQSLLDALNAAGVDMIWDCLRGECGLCAVDIVELNGELDHRDVFFSDEEKREQRRMCTCVSRLAGGSAIIDTGYRKS